MRKNRKNYNKSRSSQRKRINRNIGVLQRQMI